LPVVGLEWLAIMQKSVQSFFMIEIAKWIGLFGLLVTSQLPESKTTPPAEVTRVDFTKLKEIASSGLAVFGVTLGDSVESAKVKFEQAGLKIKARQLAGSFSVYENGDELLALDSQGERITLIALFSKMAKHLAGESALLLDPDIVLPDSALRLRLLGREDSRSDERNSIGHTVTCSYDKEGIRLIKSFSVSLGDAAPVLHLVASAKKR